MDSQPIRISDWTPHVRNTLRGVFTITLPSGLIIHRVMLHEKEDRRWIQLPAREWINQAGEKQFSVLMEFTTREIHHKFQTQTMEALDQFLGKEKVNSGRAAERISNR